MTLPQISGKLIMYRLLFFSESEAATLRLAVESKRKKRGLWIANNLLVPLLIIYSPYLLTLVSTHFEKIEFNKSIVDLTITGAFTLLGINVMRISLTLINEKVDEKKIPIALMKDVLDDIESIKAKLRLWIHILSFIGGLFYFMQVGALLDPNSSVIQYYLMVIIGLCFLSIMIGRLTSVIQTNFFDNDNLISNWLKSLKLNHEESYTDLKSEASKKGL